MLNNENIDVDPMSTQLFKIHSSADSVSFPIPCFPRYLHSDMVREWPRRQAQTKAAMKKEKPLGDKVLADVRRKVAQIEKMLEPVVENSSLASNATKELERAAQTLAKVWVKCLL